MLSNDGGATWREAGGGLPPGFAVAIADDDPDRMLYAARNRLYVSANGGVFWRSLAVRAAGHRRASPGSDEALESRNSPRATTTAEPPTSTARSVGVAVDARVERRRPADLRALRDLDLLAERDPPVPGEVKRERPRGRAVAGSSGTPCAGTNMRVFQRGPGAREAVDARTCRAPRARRSGRSAATLVLRERERRRRRAATPLS